jgi:hypothetical protein
MPDYVSKMLLNVVLIYELEGIRGVEKYAQRHSIPWEVCRKLLNEYVLTDRSVPV